MEITEPEAPNIAPQVDAEPGSLPASGLSAHEEKEAQETEETVR